MIRKKWLAQPAYRPPIHYPHADGWGRRYFDDSLSPNAATRHRYTDRPGTVASVRQGFAAFEAMPCDILVTAHPETKDLFAGLQHRARNGSSAFIDPDACRDLVAHSRERLDKRLATE